MGNADRAPLTSEDLRALMQMVEDTLIGTYRLRDLIRSGRVDEDELNALMACRKDAWAWYAKYADNFQVASRALWPQSYSCEGVGPVACNGARDPLLTGILWSRDVLEAVKKLNSRLPIRKVISTGGGPPPAPQRLADGEAERIAGEKLGPNSLEFKAIFDPVVKEQIDVLCRDIRNFLGYCDQQASDDMKTSLREFCNSQRMPSCAPGLKPKTGLDSVSAGTASYAQGLTTEQIADQLKVFACQKCPILLLGETGVGKSHLAREIHRLSGRKGKFVEINVADTTSTLISAELWGQEEKAYNDAPKRLGVVRQAERGTVFLDEIGDLSKEEQVKLNTLVQHGKVRPVGMDEPIDVDVRVVAATCNLANMRPDLMRRFTVRLHLRALRHERERIPKLALSLFEQAKKLAAAQSMDESVEGEVLEKSESQGYAKDDADGEYKKGKAYLRFSEEERNKLRDDPYDWPHNIAELQAAIENAVLLHSGTRDFTAAEVMEAAKANDMRNFVS